MKTDWKHGGRDSVAARRRKGEVRQAAMQSALTKIVETGSPSFTLREIADSIGVVHSALYRHFPSRADLLAAVAEQGFRDLLVKLQQVDPGSRGSAVARLKRLCRQHLDFALGNGPLYKVMFGPELVVFDVEGTPFHAAASALLDVATNAVSECLHAGAIEGDDPLPPSLVFWSTLHGLAMLAIDGRLDSKLSETRTIYGLLDLSVQALLDGFRPGATVGRRLEQRSQT